MPVITKSRVRLDVNHGVTVPSADYFQVERSADSGATWAPIRVRTPVLDDGTGKGMSLGNLLSVQDTHFDDAALGVGGWTPSVNCTVVRSSTQFSTGAGSLAVISVAAGDMSAQSPLVPVTAGLCYSARTRFKAGPTFTARTFTYYLRFYNSSGAQVGTNAPLLPTIDSLTEWKSVATSMIAPVGATQARVFAYWTGCGASENHYVDRVLIGQCTFYDYEAPANVPVVYRSRVATADPVYLPSAWTANIGPLTNTVTAWTITDPLDPTQTLSLLLVGDEVSFSEPQSQGIFEALGRKTKIIVNDVIQGEELSLQAWFTTQAEYDTFQIMRRSQRTLLLQSPVDPQLYVQIIGERIMRRSGVGNNRRRTVALNLVEVSAP